MLARLFLISLVTISVSAPVYGNDDSEKEILDTVACLNIENDAARLSCLDTAARALKSTRIVREADEEKLADSTKNQPAPTQSSSTATIAQGFGSEDLKSTRVNREKSLPKVLESQIVEIKIRKNKKLTLTLANGQVWRQLNADNHRIIIPKKTNDKIFTAKIKRTSIGSYFLKVVEKGQTIRVQRIK